MVKALNKRQKKMFLSQKSFYIGFSLLIILSVGLFLGFSIASLSIKTSVEKDRIINKLEDAWFDYSYNLNKEDIAYYEEKYDMLLQKSVYKDVDYDSAVLRLRPPYEKINLYSVVDGDDINKSGDILIDRFFMQEHKLKIGDNVNINENDYKIVGIVSSPDYLDILRNNMDYISNGNKFGIAVVFEDDFYFDKDKTKYNYAIKYNKPNRRKFIEELNEKGVITNYTNVENNIRIKPFDGEIVAMINIARIAPLFIILVSMLIMSVVMARQLKKEYIYIGALKALGFKVKEILAHYLILPLIIATVSSFLGVILGIGLSKPLLYLTRSEYSIPKVNMYYDYVSMIIAFLLPILLMVSTAYFSVIKAVKTNTVCLLKGGASSKRKKFTLLKIAPQKRFSFKVRYKLKEILKNVTRSLLMVLGITVAGSFMLSGFIINHSIDKLFKESFDNIFTYEYQYILKTPMYGDLEHGETQTLKELVYENDTRSFSVVLNGIDNNSQFVNIKNLDNKPIDFDKTGVVFTKSVAKKLKLKKGDEVVLRDLNRLKDYIVCVDEIANLNATNFVYMSRESLNEMLGYPPEIYTSILTDREIEMDDNLIYTKHLVSQNKENLENSISLFKDLLYFLTIIAAIIGIVVVYIVAMMLIDENSKTISMLKVMGYKTKEINSILLNSSTILVFLGFILSIPFAVLVMNKFFQAITVNMFFVITSSISFLQGVITAIFVMAIYYISISVARTKIEKINLAECLKIIE